MTHTPRLELDLDLARHDLVFFCLLLEPSLNRGMFSEEDVRVVGRSPTVLDGFLNPHEVVPLDCDPRLLESGTRLGQILLVEVLHE